MTKEEFFENINEIISDKIYLTDSLDKLNEEIETNKWSIGIDFKTAKVIGNEDLKKFLGKVIQNRIEQINKSKLNINLIFYLWFDTQAGNLNLNFINTKHEKLPFGAELEFTDSMDTIINDFLNSRYLEGIPFDELENVSDDAIAKEKNDYKLKVYQEEIVKTVN